MSFRNVHAPVVPTVLASHPLRWLLHAGMAALAIGGLCGCADDSLPTAEQLPARAGQVFMANVYPVLLRDCGFPACHGNSRRFFRVWGPGRSRLPDKDGNLPAAFDTSTGDELSTTFALARAMVDKVDPGRSPLLQKPLAVAAGGAGHEGVDAFGRDVYRTTRDNGYRVLSDWVREVSVDPDAQATAAP